MEYSFLHYKVLSKQFNFYASKNDQFIADQSYVTKCTYLKMEQSLLVSQKTTEIQFNEACNTIAQCCHLGVLVFNNLSENVFIRLSLLNINYLFQSRLHRSNLSRFLDVY